MTPGFIWNLGPFEVIVILLVALLLFGRRLPEVARSLGQGLVEFRKGLRDEPDRPKPLPGAGEKVRPEASSPGEKTGAPPDGPPDGEARPEDEDRGDGGDLAG